MKNSIVYLGITLLSFANICSASNQLSYLAKNKYQKMILTQNQSSLESTINDDQKKYPLVVEEVSFKPETVIKKNTTVEIEYLMTQNNKVIENNDVFMTDLFYIEKPIEEVMIDDNQIIEGKIDNEIKPLHLEETIEEDILENNKIIENNISFELQALDFDKINKSNYIPLQIVDDKFIGM